MRQRAGGSTFSIWFNQLATAPTNRWSIISNGSTVGASYQPNNWSCTQSGFVGVPSSAAPGKYTAFAQSGVTRPSTDTGWVEAENIYYDFYVVKLNISSNKGAFGGVNFMGVPNPTPTAMVGQQVALYANIDGIYGITPAPTVTYQWTVGGEKIKSFTITNWTPPTTTPPVSEILPSGHKDEIDPNDLKNSSVSFYFTKGESVNVKCDVTVKGKAISSNGTINVLRPTLNSFTSTYTPLNPPWNLMTDFLTLGQAVIDPVTGTNYSGIVLHANIDIPTIGAGELSYVQVINFTSSNQPFGAQPINYGSHGADILDAPDETKVVYSSKSVTGGQQGVVFDYPGDSPGSAGSSTDISEAFDGHFKTYLMYKPSGGIRVTLGLLSWDAKATASMVNGDLKVDANNANPSSTGAGPTGSDVTDLPKWTSSKSYAFAHPY